MYSLKDNYPAKPEKAMISFKERNPCLHYLSSSTANEHALVASASTTSLGGPGVFALLGEISLWLSVFGRWDGYVRWVMVDATRRSREL